MSYRILVNQSDTWNLSGVVNALLKEGWRPLGGPFVYDGKLCQAVIK